MSASRQSDAPARASYASDPAQSRGRLFSEPESQTRSVFQRDRDRIIHSGAFRRLQYKTQVFVYHEGDHYRTRLTHSLEVAQIARSLARVLMVDEDLAEALALAHDLGHPPFGHAGEEGLQEVMAPYGGFDHNGHALRLVTRLEARYAGFDGLNLTWETLEGLAKHNGPLIAAPGNHDELPWSVAEYGQQQDLELHTQPGIEAQIAALADDIAYNTHDVDDGLRAGLFDVADLADLPLVGPLISEVANNFADLQQSRLIHETTRRMIDRMVDDLLAETNRRLAAAQPGCAADVRSLSQPVVAMSREMEGSNRDLKTFLFERMYRHYRVSRMTSKARRIVSELFGFFMADPGCLPTDWRLRAEGDDKIARARLVADYIAGMTDRFALDEHRRLFDLYE
ncbi:MAG: deoxyguanosinetriphosphate triphosphohydrolase [Rhodospirillaceae bacterium]|jgi:dGTPase|nr:deoxyguanosinetriphosphate triphosphohydrolase [Rhodospirillaceae bacterium]MBT5456491.1 deoxyguanosinetriphosphate triphosphohydrolase [Rhodospirillaceae bacterium]